ncbi:MAG TPA: guanylate kinase [Verrucomicrobiae bacterium]|nr:guanylate kinase [Verrucomicrobiae bacterium]
MSLPHKPVVYIISAPSGSGKSTLVNKLLKTIPDLDFSISYTTRPPRGREQNGKQYNFVTRNQFEEMIRAGAFLEHADVFGNYYGTARRFLSEAELAGHDLLLDIDVQGARQIKQTLPDAASIFILPPNRKTLEKRLRERGEDAESVIQRRLDTATREIEDYDKYNYVLINDELEKSIRNLQDIVLAERLGRTSQPLSPEQKAVVDQAERCRLTNVRERIQPILASFSTSVPSAGI